VGEGTCTGFCKEEMQELLKMFSDVMSELPGITNLVDMELILVTVTFITCQLIFNIFQLSLTKA